MKKFFSRSLKEKGLLLASFLFVIISVGSHVHFTFITKPYVFLAFTLLTKQCRKQLLSSVTFNNTVFLRIMYNVGMKGQRQGIDSSGNSCSGRMTAGV